MTGWHEGPLAGLDALGRPIRYKAANSNWRGGKSSHPLYWIYHDMLGRCLRPTHARYADYGGRGITVCQRWRDDFWAFVEDMGPRPTDGRWTLERIDNDGPYSSDNCCWATYWEQRHNRRPDRPQNTCRNGHEYTPDNTRQRRGYRECIQCYEATRDKFAPQRREYKRRMRAAARGGG